MKTIAEFKYVPVEMKVCTGVAGGLFRKNRERLYVLVHIYYYTLHFAKLNSEKEFQRGFSQVCTWVSSGQNTFDENTLTTCRWFWK